MKQTASAIVASINTVLCIEWANPQQNLITGKYTRTALVDLLSPGQEGSGLGAEKGDILFIDEIHRLQKTIEEYLYPAMEDFKLDIIIDQGPNARSVRRPQISKASVAASVTASPKATAGATGQPN